MSRHRHGFTGRRGREPGAPGGIVRQAVQNKKRPPAARTYQDPRVEQTQRTVLEAAAAILQERGYGGCTLEAIIERSGVARTTIYRHWPSRTELLFTVLKNYQDELPMPNTGSLRTDLIEFLTLRSHKLEDSQFDLSLQSLPGLLEASKRDPSLVGLPAQRTAELVENIRKIIEDGQRRGEVSAERDLDVLANIIVGGIIIQRTFLNKKLSDDYVIELVTSFIEGAA